MAIVFFCFVFFKQGGAAIVEGRGGNEASAVKGFMIGPAKAASGGSALPIPPFFTTSKY